MSKKKLKKEIKRLKKKVKSLRKARVAKGMWIWHSK